MVFSSASAYLLFNFDVVFLGNIDGKVKGLPFNQYSWLTTHNAFALLGATSGTGGLLVTATNQQDSITNQLNVFC